MAKKNGCLLRRIAFPIREWGARRKNSERLVALQGEVHERKEASFGGRIELTWDTYAKWGGGFMSHPAWGETR